MRYTDARNRPVVNTQSATTVGALSGVIVDPATARVIALRVKKSHGAGDTVHWEDVIAFGTDAVTVESNDVLVKPRGRAAQLDNKAAEVVGKRILTDEGTEVGTVADIDFDPDTGQVLSLVGSAGVIAGSRLVGCGSYAVIVKAETPPERHTVPPRV